jgi:hypothetical protein
MSRVVAIQGRKSVATSTNAGRRRTCPMNSAVRNTPIANNYVASCRAGLIGITIISTMPTIPMGTTIRADCDL